MGSVDVPGVCAGALDHRGDVIVADDDGVCAEPRGQAAAVMEKAQPRIDSEVAKRERFVAGALGIDIDDKRTRLAQEGLRYVWIKCT